MNDKPVAVADDNAIGREATSALLLAHGCPVVAGAPSAGLLDELKRHLRAPDQLLTDWHIGPNDSGLELLLRVRDLFDATIPLLLVTADTGPDPAGAASIAGVALLRKPVSAERLLLA